MVFTSNKPELNILSYHQKQVLASRGTPSRCSFVWFNEEKQEWVRCLNDGNQTHGPKHEHVGSSVNVGEETQVSGSWVGGSRG